MPTAPWSIRITGPSPGIPARAIRTGCWSEPARRNSKAGMATRRRVIWLVACALALMPVACGKRSPEPDLLVLEQQGFADLPGWAQDDLSGAIPALLKSCQVIAKAKPDRLAGLDLVSDDFTGPCLAAAAVPAGDGAAARLFFETYFVPFRASNHAERDGLFTGYYEAELHGATSPDARFATPLYRRPA